MDEMNERGLPINYTMKYYMTFTTSRDEAFDLIHRRHLANLNSPMYFLHKGQYKI